MEKYESWGRKTFDVHIGEKVMDARRENDGGGSIINNGR